MADKYSVDDFLNQSNTFLQPTLKVTVKQSPEVPGNVRLTPYIDEYGCVCELTVELPKAVIRSLEPTGKTAYCCGEPLPVAIIEFNEGTTIPIENHFAIASQVAQAAQLTQTAQLAQAAGASLTIGRNPDRLAQFMDRGDFEHNPGPRPAPSPPNEHGFTGCGIVCRVTFPLWYDQLIAAFKILKANGVPEAKARELARDGGALAAELYRYHLGPVAGVAAGMVAAGCGLCAVDSAY